MRRTTRLKKPQVPEIEDLYRFDDLGGRPKYGGVEMTHETDIPTYETIMEEVDGKIAVEADARSDEDAALQENIDGEVLARQGADAVLQSQIDAVVASSDVKDIVGTYAALEAYDTSTLGDNDIIKVLQDETHQDETTYYRWVLADEEFSLIGEEGPYYTKAATDALLNAKQNTLTAGSNVQIVNDTISATDTTYTAGTGLALNGTQFSVDTTAIATQSDLTAGLATKQDTLTAGANVQINNNTISATDTTYSDFTGTDGTAAGAAGLVPAPATTDAGKFLKADGTWDTAGGGSANCKELTAADYNYDSNNDGVNDTVALWLLDPGVYWWGYNFADGGGITFTTSSSGTLTNAKLLPYSQQVTIGYYGNDNSGFYKIQAFSRSGLVQDNYFNWAPFIPYIVNTSNGTVVNFQTNAIPVGRGDGSGPTVVQTTGSSTTNVMSQKAVTDTLFRGSNPSQIQIGSSAAASGSRSIAIGGGSTANKTDSIAIGTNPADKAEATGNVGVAIGTGAKASGAWTVALGTGAKANTQGQMDISTGSATTSGYNGSNYRLLTGVHDPVNAHDAATKGYVDGLVGNIAAALNAINNGGGN